MAHLSLDLVILKINEEQTVSPLLPLIACSLFLKLILLLLNTYNNIIVLGLFTNTDRKFLPSILVVNSKRTTCHPKPCRVIRILRSWITFTCTVTVDASNSGFLNIESCILGLKSSSQTSSSLGKRAFQETKSKKSHKKHKLWY